MRKQLKKKKRACGLCKPHKRAMSNRWKEKEKQAMDISEQEIRGFNPYEEVVWRYKD